jgi:integrase
MYNGCVRHWALRASQRALILGVNTMLRQALDSSRLRFKIEALVEPDQAWNELELATYLRDWRRLGDNTIAQRMRDLRRMATHPLVPVKIHGTRFDLVDSFYQHMRHRETVEHKAATAVKNDFKAVASLGDFRGIPREVWPRPPTVPRRARKILPSPEDIHDLLHSDYAPDPQNNYANHLVRYMLVLDFAFGLRFPNEAFSLRITDFDPAGHTLVIREPKKGGSTRRVLIEPSWLCCGPNRPSLAQFLRWRAKVDVGGTDAFFLMPNGEPFKSKYQLKRWLDTHVKPKFPWFHTYLGRIWCANARLIEWKYDYARVAEWLGHESVDMTRRTYEHEARLHRKKYGEAWLERAFKAIVAHALPAKGSSS